MLYILNAHPQIYGLPEFKNILITKDSKSVRQFKQVTEKYLNRVLKRSFLNQLPESALQRKADNLFYSAFDEHLSLRGRYIRMALSVNKVFDDENRDKTLITHIVHKVPYYTFFVDDLLKIFPEAKFIINIRDPRAQNYSHIKRQATEKLMAGKSNPIGRSVLWTFYAKETLNLLKKYPDKCYLFQYEKFVENPDKIIKEILQFLNVPYHPGIWNYHIPVKKFLNNYQSYLSENKIKKYIPLSKPVSTEYKEDWKKMHPDDIKTIENICGKYLHAFNYQPLYDKTHLSFYENVKKTIYTMWYWFGIKSPFAKYVHKIFQLYFF